MTGQNSFAAVLPHAEVDRAEVDRAFLLYQGLVRAIAWKIHRRVPQVVEIDDLIAYGQIGLLEALQRFDEDRGLKFATFAWHRVRGAILDGLAKMSWFDRIEFEKGGYEHAQAAGGSTRSSETPSQRWANRSSFCEASFPGVGDPPAARAEHREVVAFLMLAIADLPPREAGLLRGVFFEGRTLSEAARRVGISTAWASRLQNRTLADLRIALDAHGFGSS